jgi:hypothetical protein
LAHCKKNWQTIPESRIKNQTVTNHAHCTLLEKLANKSRRAASHCEKNFQEEPHQKPDHNQPRIWHTVRKIFKKSRIKNQTATNHAHGTL